MTTSVIQIAAIEGWMPHLQAVNTSTKADTVNNLNLKQDISIYNRVEGVAPPDRTDFSRMELWMEFKTNNNGAAFQDPRDDTEDNCTRRGQGLTDRLGVGEDDGRGWQ